MAIPVILKGDTTATIYLQLADGYDYSDCWLDVEFCGVVTTRELPQAGSIVELHFTADETARFPLGTSKVFFSIRNSAGMKKSLPWAKIKVTDAPEEVASPVIVIDPATLGDIDTTAADSLGDVKRKLNQLLSVLRGGALCIVSALCLPVLADIGPTTTLNDVPGNTTLSNLVASSGAAVGGGGDVTKAYVDKRDAATYAAATNAQAIATAAMDAASTIPFLRNRDDLSVGPRDVYWTMSYNGGEEMYLDPTDAAYTNFVGTSEDGSASASVTIKRSTTGYRYTVEYQRPPPLLPVTFNRISAKPLTQLSNQGVVATEQWNGNYYATNTLALVSDVAAVSNLVGSAAANATEALNLASAVSTVVIGEDCQLVSTNYDSKVHMPSLFLRFQIPNEESGTNEWHVVWSEMTRWNWFLDGYLPTNYFNKTEIAAELEQKADRAWGYYDSTTGNYAPEGFTWVSSPSIAIAGGLAYQRVVTTQGAIWVLESNGMTTVTGGETNGFFRISDDKGNAIFEITKGTEVLAGATAGALRTETVDGITHLYITYNVESTAHPTIEVCNDLKNPEWATETDESCKANVSWTGQSGAWVAEVWGKQAYNSLFVRASYKKGQRDVITNSAPVSFTEVVIGGVTYTCKVGTATVDGETKRVLVLE